MIGSSEAIFRVPHIDFWDTTELVDSVICGVVFGLVAGNELLVFRGQPVRGGWCLTALVIVVTSI